MGSPTATIGWRRRDEDGLWMIWDLPNGAEHAPMLEPGSPQARIVDAVEEQWGDLCRAIGGRNGIPDGWLQAMIYRESGGNQYARNQEGTPGYPADDGIGLMQITSPALKGHMADEELFKPVINIGIGARYAADLGHRYGWDFPRVAAAFNAGSVQPSSKNRWGMVQTTGHVDAEVLALNYWTYRKLDEERRAAALAVAKQFTTWELLEGKQDPEAES